MISRRCLIGTMMLLAGHVMAAEPESNDPEVPVVNQVTIADSGLPSPPVELTSFGAAIAGDNVYLYGGHTGTAHTYSTDDQSGQLYRLDLAAESPAWETLPSGPKLQGLALVAHGDDVIRIGGFTALNSADEDQHLQSQATVARFASADQQWHSMPDLPEPRSSIDAVVDGETLFVAGGWQLSGSSDDPVWHDTAWSLDLANSNATWQPLGDSFAARRAVSIAVMANQLHVIGGMLPEGKTTRDVLTLAPASGAWSAGTWATGPELPGDAMNGFGTAACVVDQTLYVNTIHGYLHRLQAGSDHWDTIGQVDPPRFFHRMLPWPGHGLLLIGGVNMETGKFSHIDLIRLDG